MFHDVSWFFPVFYHSLDDTFFGTAWDGPSRSWTQERQRVNARLHGWESKDTACFLMFGCCAWSIPRHRLNFRFFLSNGLNIIELDHYNVIQCSSIFLDTQSCIQYIQCSSPKNILSSKIEFNPY